MDNIRWLYVWKLSSVRAHKVPLTRTKYTNTQSNRQATKKTSDVTISGEFSLTILLLVLQEVSSMVKYDTNIHSSVVEF